MTAAEPSPPSVRPPGLTMPVPAAREELRRNPYLNQVPGEVNEWDQADIRHATLAYEVLRLHQPDDALIEQVARALAKAEPDRCFDDLDDNGAGCEDRDYYRERARAALAALRG